MKIGIISLGCAKNLVDTENLLGLLEQSKQEIVQNPKEAEAIIINTCGFIESAKQEAIDTILKIADYKQQNLKKLIVMGCLVQRYQEELEKEMPEVDCFIAIRQYGDLGNILSNALGVPIANDYGKAPRVLSGKPWMAYLRIADGCDNRCSYCAIPLIRGPLRSFPIEELVAEAKRLAKQGVKELNLIAQDSSRYGVDWDEKLHLSQLLKELDQIEGIHWIRILYLYPDEIPDDLIETIQQSTHILPYFDIPIQHGSDRMLQAMHRRGNAKLILERTQKIRSSFPNPILRTTLIAGFPGETEKDQQKQLDLIEKVQWDHLGAFTYSAEEDTPSFELEDDVPSEIKEKRKQEILETQDQIAQKRLASWIGKTMEVLVEGEDGITRLGKGRSAFQAPDGVDGCVRFHPVTPITQGSFIQVQITKVSGQNLIGQEVEKGRVA